MDAELSVVDSVSDTDKVTKSRPMLHEAGFNKDSVFARDNQ